MYVCNNCAKQTQKLYPFEFNRPENYNELPTENSKVKHVKIFVCAECLEGYEGHLVNHEGRAQQAYRDCWIKFYKERLEKCWGKRTDVPTENK